MRGQLHAPAAHLAPGKDPVTIVQEAGLASGPVWTVAENLAPPGFDPRTVQPVGSRYTDYATRPTCTQLNNNNNNNNNNRLILLLFILLNFLRHDRPLRSKHVLEECNVSN